LAATSRSAADVANERVGLERTLLELQGNTAELRRRDVAALDVSNRWLQEQIYALEDAKAAQEAATQAISEAAAKATSITNERLGLERALLQLQGDTAELRRLEVAALNPSNQELQKYIYELQDQQAAVKDAADAAQQLRTAWSSVGDSIASEILRINGMSRAQFQSLAGAQAEFAIVSAKARAGDQSAGASLPELSRAVLQLAGDQANSAEELAFIRAATTSSLMQTEAAVRSMALGGGVSITPVSTGNGFSTTPVALSSSAQAQGGTAQSAEQLRDLLSEIRGIRSDMRAQAVPVAESTRKTADLLDRFERDGLTVKTDFDTPLHTVVA
jgi:predicted transcriptional regulator